MVSRGIWHKYRKWYFKIWYFLISRAASAYLCQISRRNHGLRNVDIAILNTKARYKRPLPWEAQSHLSINLRGVRIKSNMAANSNTRKINKHEINTVFFFFFAFVKFRNATAIENIFALDKYNSRRVFYRGVERLVRRQIWPSWSHERRKQSRQQGIVAQIDLIKAWIRSLFRQI